MNKLWNAVVLAGDRGPSDPVATAANVNGKAFAKINKITLLERVISVLYESESVNKIYTVGPQSRYLAENVSLQSFLKKCSVENVEPADGPSASAMRGVIESNYYPTLIVTCDLALLNVRVLDQYCMAMANMDADFVACAIDYQHIYKKIPELKKTQYRFGKHSVCFANVFSVLAPDGLKAIAYWQEVEKSRKKPIELVRKIDWLSLVNYKLGRLSLEQVASKLSDKVGARLKMASLPHAELAIDVDSAHDYTIMQKYLSS